MKPRAWSLSVLILVAGLALTWSVVLSLAQELPAEISNGDPTPTPTPRAQNIELVGQIGGPARAVAQQGDYAYVLTGPLLVVLDVSDAANSLRVGSCEVTEGYGQDVTVAGD